MNSMGTCANCSKAIESGMSFCLFCGLPAGLSTAAGPSVKDGKSQLKDCPSCGRSDRLSARFCVFCGANTQLPPISSVTPYPVSPARVHKFNPGLFSAGFALSGIGLGFFLSSLPITDKLEQLAANANWPARGLVIYLSKPGVPIRITESSGKAFIMGQSGDNGALSILDLAPGMYRVEAGVPGKGITRDVQVDKDQVEVLGFPERLTL